MKEKLFFYLFNKMQILNNTLKFCTIFQLQFQMISSLP